MGATVFSYVWQANGVSCLVSIAVNSTLGLVTSIQAYGYQAVFWLYAAFAGIALGFTVLLPRKVRGKEKLMEDYAKP